MANNEDIDFGYESEALNDKADRDFNNLEDGASVPFHIAQMDEEIDNRIAADNRLQEQIDAIVSKQELADIVGTYADLQNYDTSGLANNSIIEVLQDETHDGAVSYYKYSTSTHSFTYIGSTAASYTKEEADGRFAHLSGNETIAGTKTFSTVPLVGTATTGDNSTKAASTAFVASAISTAASGYVKTTGDQTIAGDKTFTGNVIATTQDVSDDSTKVATTEFVNDAIAAAASDYVHKAGAETITGTKTIATGTTDNRLLFQVTDYHLGDNPQSNHFNGYKTIDADGNEFANSNSAARTGGTVSNNFWVKNKMQDGTEVTGSLGVYAETSGLVYAVAPEVTDKTDNSTKIATTSFINGSNNNVVHKTGDETINGQKTFGSSLKRQTDIDITTTEGEQERTIFTAYGSNNKLISLLNATRSGTYTSTRLRACNENVTAGPNWADIRTVVRDNGEASVEFHVGNGLTNYSNTCATNMKTSALIPTVGWVNDSSKSLNVVHRDSNETIAGTKTFTNNPIVKTSEPMIMIQDSNNEKGVAPSATTYQWLGAIYDKNGIDQSNKLAQLYHTMYTGGNTDLHIQLFKPTASSTDIATDIVLKSSGAFEIPTPTEDTTSSVQAATVGWVKGKIPTNNNQLTNGAGYITSAALTPYALDSSISTVGKSNDYEDLDNKPTIPTVNNAKLTIQKNSSKVAEFTANASTDVTCDITVPTQPSDIGAAASSHNHVSSEISDLSTTISTAISNKADKATTISGYGITDAYTKTEIDSKISSVYKPAGSVAYASLPTPASTNLGNVYNVTDSFTTDNRFIEGSGKTYPAGTNVVIIQSSSSYYFDVLAGMVDLSGYVPTSRKINNKALTGDITLSASDVGAQPSGDYVTTSRKVNGHDLSSDVTVTKSDVGLGNVDNTADANKSVASAATLTTARTIDGVDFDGSKNITRFCVCDTAAGTVAKTATCDGFKLETGAIVFVKFTNTNTVDNPTLNINSTGDKLIKYRNGTFNKGYVAANRIYPFVYDGTYWQWVGDLDTNTTNQLRYNGNLKANTAINASTIIVGTKDGYRSVAADVSFDISYPIMWANKAISAGSTGTENYEAITGINVNTAIGNSSWTGTQYSVYYLVGTLNGSTFTISSPVGTTTVPTTDDGKCYIPLGYMYNTTQGSFYPLNKIFAYKNGKFQEVTTSVAWDDVTGKPNSFTPAAHNQASNTINAMTGYSKPSSTSAITATDTLNAAVGKLEKAIDLLPVDSSVVHKTGDETIAGTKTFTPDRFIEITTRSDANGAGLKIINKDDSTKNTRLIQYTVADGTYYSRLLNSSYNKNAYIDLTINSEGKRYLGLNAVDSTAVVSPTEDTTTSTQIDTVGARNTKLASYQIKATYDSTNEMLVL